MRRIDRVEEFDPPGIAINTKGKKVIDESNARFNERKQPFLQAHRRTGALHQVAPR